MTKKTQRSGYGGYNNLIEKWMMGRFEQYPDHTPSRVASDFRRITKSTVSKIFLIDLAKKIKNRRRMQIARGRKKTKIDYLMNNESPSQKKPVKARSEITIDSSLLDVLDHKAEPHQVDEDVRGMVAGDAYLNRYWQTYIAPHREGLLKAGIYDLVYNLFRLLVLNKSYPSIMDKNKYDRESCDFADIASVFKNVTLIEHTFYVAHYVSELTKAKPLLYSGIPTLMLLLETLCHDIGKLFIHIPRFKKIDHAKLSAMIGREIIRNRQPGWADTIYENINMHHETPIESNNASIICKADYEARRLEHSSFSNLISYDAMQAWFKTDEFLQKLSETINVLHEGQIQSVSYKSLVYFTPDCLHRSGLSLATSKRAIDLRFYRTPDRKNVLLDMVKIIRKDGLITGIGEGYFGRHFEISYSHKHMKNKTIYLLPLPIELFGEPYKIESRKTGYLRIIEQIIPSSFK
ncbi:MAG: HD domain-containing protein [Pseudomonadota bacterium]|nr:HD domain-containing protein [Pseudomonadota bacterium]